MQPGEFEPRGFVESLCDVEGLHRLAGGAFHQVVQRADDYQSITVRVALEADVAVVAASEYLRFGVAMDAAAFLDDTDKGFVTVGCAVNFPDILFFEFLVQEDVAGCQNATYHFDRSRREMDIVCTQFLLDFTEMAMRGRFVRSYRTATFGMVAAFADGITALARSCFHLYHGGFDYASLDLRNLLSNEVRSGILSLIKANSHPQSSEL